MIWPLGPGVSELVEASGVEWKSTVEVVLPQLGVSSLVSRLFQQSIITVVNLVISPRIGIFRRVRAVTEAEVAMGPRESLGSLRAATTVGNQPMTVTMQMSRSAIRVQNLNTCRMTAPKWDTTLLVKLVAISRPKASEVNYHCCGDSRHLVEECATEAIA